MEPIDGLGKLTRLIQKRVQNKNVGGSRRTNNADQPPRQAPTATLEHQLHTKIKQLHDRNASSESIARTLIEILLTWEFSDKLHNEPKFNALVQQVRRSIQDTPQLETALQQFATQLQNKTKTNYQK